MRNFRRHFNLRRLQMKTAVDPDTVAIEHKVDVIRHSSSQACLSTDFDECRQHRAG